MKTTIILASAFAAVALAAPRITMPYEKRDGQVCIAFESTANPWYYTLAAPWGTGSGDGASLNGQLCVPVNQDGGAMFLGPDPNPGPGSTKFECAFLPSGMASCDVSLVDGFSIGLRCSIGGGSTFGGGNLNYAGVAPCPDQQGPNCINDQGYADSQSDVDAYFQVGVQDGNNYCIWKNCPIFNFETSQGLSCTVN